MRLSIRYREEKLKGRQEQLDSRSLARNDPIVEKEGLVIEISGVSGLSDASGFDDARVDGECEEGRPERVPLLDLPADLESERGQPAEWNRNEHVSTQARESACALPTARRPWRRN